MPGYGPSRPSVSLRDLVRKETPEGVRAAQERREQDARESDERVRTHAASRDCQGRRSYLMSCDTYTTGPRSHYARAHRLVRARGDELRDARAHVVPNDPYDPLVRSVCGVKPGLDTGSIAWGKTLSQATCPNCLLAVEEARTGWWGPGTGDRSKCRS